MIVTKTVTGNRMEIALEGKFDAASAPKFEAEIAPALEGITELIIDMEKLCYISSAGLRTLLFLKQTLDEQRGSIAVRNVPETVMSIFEVTNFIEIIPVI